MLYKRILKNIILLIKGKGKVQEIPSKIAYYCLDYYRLARRMKRSRFSIDDVIFRPINPDDKLPYVEFVCNYFKDNSSERKNRISIPKYNEEFLYYIALYKKRIVGGVGMRMVSYKDTNLWRINGLSILHDLRGYGIGKKLLKTIISTVKDDNFIILLDVYKDNDRAIKLYKKVGFSVIHEREKFQIDNIKYPSEKLVMVLESH